ncbi:MULTISPECIES: PIG-L family deacetylase [unclassified Haladaptatus]|uniref:PIG-L deacetylase family protein n=1 Tax=unclassified Haladaptatus TaxID=2622732 RepID=UPI0007B472D3|nr:MULTISPECIES: PIG-L family deacetylase [unclassified Haladaptatus]KZN23387.1 GlcNAc-PI de-N-acetylase [Haladaptatus sp. R4]MCO8243687.1 PIG-L family deacetylase [Haladaptatus sp. AB643]MCO8255096.1 PIG-L family deacetylase [Haladaptatus sp. AB618]
MHLVAVVAHPDDADIFCGGTLAKHAERGDDVTVVYMTRGEYGGFDTTESAVAATREKEAEAAAETLGAETAFLGFEDGRITYSMENRLRLVEALREHRPDVVLTHFSDDMHPDHRATSRLVTDAYYMAALPLLETDDEPWEPDNVYYFGKATSSFEPEVYIDISEQQSTKEEAILEHESQVEWLNEHGGVDSEFEDILADVRAQARVLGRTRGAGFAEGFVPLHERASEFLD